MLYTQNLEVISPKLRGDYFKVVNRISKDLNKKWKKKNYVIKVMEFDNFSEAYDFSGELITGVAMKLRGLNIPNKEEEKKGAVNAFLKGKYVLDMSTEVKHEDKYVVYFKYN